MSFYEFHSGCHCRGETYVCHRGYYYVSLSRTHYKTGLRRRWKGKRKRKVRWLRGIFHPAYVNPWIWPEHLSVWDVIMYNVHSGPAHSGEGLRQRTGGKRRHQVLVTATGWVELLQPGKYSGIVSKSLSDSGGKSVDICPTKCLFKLGYQQALSSKPYWFGQCLLIQHKTKVKLCP